MSLLRREPSRVQSSLSALLIGVSAFFRDEAVFEHLRNVVLPSALRPMGAVRVYSAGCAAGQELYSVGILLDELGGLEGSHLLGADCRTDAIIQAESGCFAFSELKNITTQGRQRYFCSSGRHAWISPRLRRKTAWRVADIAVFQGCEAWDLILFRNVAIYLQREYANGVWQQLDKQLKPGGVLVTGSAERPPEYLCWKRESACVYRKPLHRRPLLS